MADAAPALRRPVTGPLGAHQFAVHLQVLIRLRDQLTGLDGRRHEMGLPLFYENERRDLGHAITFLEHIRRNGYEVTP